MKNDKQVSLRAPFSIRLLKAYVKFINTKLFFRNYVIRGKENILPTGTPTIVASNHQNCMLDPLIIIYALSSYAKFLTRASVFSNPRIGNFLRKVGLLPTYRMEIDGQNAAENNKTMWNTTEEELLGGQAIVIFPEGKHQHQRVLGEFQSGYTKMAFDAAQASDFQREIFILPSANHYSHYEHMRSDVLVSFGEPLSLQPYYELFKTKPRTAQRQVNAIIRERIQSMMLCITDLENYDAIEFLIGAFKEKTIEQQQLKHNIEGQLIASQQINAACNKLKETEPEKAAELFKTALETKNALEEAKLRPWLFTKRVSTVGIFFQAVLGLLLLPLFIFSLIPNILIYAAPYLVTRKLADTRFRATIYLGVSLITIPLVYILFFVAEWLLTDCAIFALVHTAILPVLGIFAWNYKIAAIKLRAKIRFKTQRKSRKFHNIASQIETLWSVLQKTI